MFKLFTFSVVEYLVFGGILAFMNGILVVFSSQKAGRLVAAVLGVYMAVFIFVYPAYIDYAVSIGIFDYSDLDPLLPLQDSCVAYTMFSILIEIPMYTVYSTLVAAASFIGITVPLFRGIVLHSSLIAISAISMVSAIALGKLSWFSFLQLGLFGASCLLGGTYLYWDERKIRMLTQEAKRYYAVIESRGKTTARDIMCRLNAKDEKEFSRVIQKLLDEHWIIAVERQNKIWFSTARKGEPYTEN